MERCVKKTGLLPQEAARVTSGFTATTKNGQSFTARLLCCKNREFINRLYLDDKPYPSVLIYGKTADNRPLHMVCAYDEAENIVIVVTVYHPNPKLWIDYRRRKGS